MSSKKLDIRDTNIIFQCLVGILEEDEWMDEVDYTTRLGVTKIELVEVIRRWPDVNLDWKCVELAVNNTLNEIINGIRISDAEWKGRFDFSISDLNDVYCHWKEVTGSRCNEDEGYFGNLM